MPDASSNVVGLSVGLAIAGAVVLLCVSALLLTICLCKRAMKRHPQESLIRYIAMYVYIFSLSCCLHPGPTS